MDHFERINELMPFYGKLLTSRQMEIMQMYYYDNLSLSEIADSLTISRNGVYDTLKKSESLLQEYEEKMQLCSLYNKRMAIYDKIAEVGNDDIKNYVEQLKKLED